MGHRAGAYHAEPRELTAPSFRGISVVMVGIGRWAWLAVLGWFVACGGRTRLDDDDTAVSTVGGHYAGNAGRAGQAGWGTRQGGASYGGAWPTTGGIWNTGGYWYPTGGWWPGTGGRRSGGGTGPGIGGRYPTYGGYAGYGGWYPGYGGYGAMPDGGPPDASYDAPSEGGVPWDALPSEGGPLVDCLTCARDFCSGPVDACVANPVCLNGIFCTLLTCGSSRACMVACFNGDLLAINAGMNAAICMVSSCGERCLSAIGGL